MVVYGLFETLFDYTTLPPGFRNGNDEIEKMAKGIYSDLPQAILHAERYFLVLSNDKRNLVFKPQKSTEDCWTINATWDSKDGKKSDTPFVIRRFQLNAPAM